MLLPPCSSAWGSRTDSGHSVRHAGTTPGRCWELSKPDEFGQAPSAVDGRWRAATQRDGRCRRSGISNRSSPCWKSTPYVSMKPDPERQTSQERSCETVKGTTSHARGTTGRELGLYATGADPAYLSQVCPVTAGRTLGDLSCWQRAGDHWQRPRRSSPAHLPSRPAPRMRHDRRVLAALGFPGGKGRPRALAEGTGYAGAAKSWCAGPLAPGKVLVMFFQTPIYE